MSGDAIWRAVLYDRVSTVKQAETSYSAGKDGYHLKDCRAAALARECTIVAELHDADSGAEWELPGITQALEMARRREYDVLIVSDSSRFARSEAKHHTYVELLRKRGVRVIFLDLPDLDDTPLGQFIHSVMAGKNALERGVIRERTSRGRVDKAERGQVVGGGPAPYGYRYRRDLDARGKRHVTVGLEPDPTTAPIVERIYAEALDRSIAEIAAGLNADGVPVPAMWRPSPKRPLPTAWSTSTVRRIATSAVYRGAWSYGSIAVMLRPGDAIVTPERHAAVAARLAGRACRRAPRGPVDEDRFTLRGRLVCGYCRTPLSANTVAATGASAAAWPGGRYRRYECGRAVPSQCERYGWARCSGPLPGLLAADDRTDRTGRLAGMRGVEDYAWEMVIALASSPERFERLVAERAERHADERETWCETLDVLDQQIAAQEKRARRAREEKQDYERGTDGYRQYAEMEGRAEHALAGLRDERAAVVARRPPGAGAEEVAELKGALDFIRARLDVTVAGLERLDEIERLRGMAPAERRAYLERLDVRGTVRRSAGGVRVGRDAVVEIEWLVMGSETSFLKLVVLHTSTGASLAALAAWRRAPTD